MKTKKRVNLHVISDERGMEALSASSKMNAEWPFVLHLFEMGRNAALAWLENYYDDIGHVSTLPIRSILHGCSQT